MEETVLPIGCFLCLLGIGLLIAIPVQIRKRPAWRGKGICFHCGYRLSGLPRRARCPECGSDATSCEAARKRVPTQAYISTGLPLAGIGVLALLMLPHGLSGAVMGVFAGIPLVLLIWVLAQMERHVSPAGMLALGLGAVLPATAVLAAMCLLLADSADGQAAFSLFVAPYLAGGAAGIGLGAAALVERWACAER